MVDEARVVRLLRAASETLHSLRSEQPANAERRKDPLWLPGIKYLLIGCIESCIDVAQHICSSEGWGTPRDNGDAMRALGQHAVISPRTADQLRMAVGFRDVLVREYVDVDDAIVLDRLADLTDLEHFVREVSAWLIHVAQASS